MEGPAEVYREDEEGGHITCSAVNNVLNLVLRDEGLMKFVKYVSKDAPGSRVDVELEVEVEVQVERDTEGSEEGEDKDGSIADEVGSENEELTAAASRFGDDKQD